MLPKVFSPTGEYTSRQEDRARGYRLLVHAEVESYLEDISRETVTNAIKKWKSEKKPSQIMISFLASYHSSWSATNELDNEEIINIARSRKNVTDSVNEIVELAQLQFTKKLKNNHGIKDKNFKTLIVPLGIEINELDATWLTNLDSFGTRRGDVAHKSAHTQGTINPQDELNAVSNILIGLEELDRKIHKINLG